MAQYSSGLLLYTFSLLHISSHYLQVPALTKYLVAQHKPFSGCPVFTSYCLISYFGVFLAIFLTM